MNATWTRVVGGKRELNVGYNSLSLTHKQTRLEPLGYITNLIPFDKLAPPF
jgi:hypothetical protein